MTTLRDERRMMNGTQREQWKPYPAYKPSGVEWLGEIPAHWKTERVKSLFQFLDSHRIPLSSEERGPMAKEFPYYGASGIIDYVEDYLFDEPLILVAEDGANLFSRSSPLAFVAQGKYWVNNHAHILKPLDSLIDYWAYVLASIVYDPWITGSAQPKLTSDNLSSILLAVPPFEEQALIVAHLNRETAKLDTLIAKHERLIELLQEKRTALISHAVTRGLDPSAPMKDSGMPWLGMIPAHWEVRRLKFAVTKMIAGPFGSSLTKDLYTAEGYRVYGQEQVIPGDFSIGDYYIPEEMYRAFSRYAVASGDILVSCVGTFGKVAVVPSDAEPGIINPRLAKLVPAQEVVSPSYLGLLLRSRVSFEQMEQVSRGGTMGVINLGLLSEILLPLPSLPEQDTIIRFLNREMTKLDALIAKIRASIEKLREYRAALISAAVTGKIDLRGFRRTEGSHDLEGLER